MAAAVGPQRRRRESRHVAVRARLAFQPASFISQLCDVPIPSDFGFENKAKDAHLPLAGAGAYGAVYVVLSGHVVAKVSDSFKVVRPNEGHLTAVQLQKLQRTLQQPWLTEEEVFTVLAASRALCPRLFAIRSCPASNKRVMFMERWARTLSEDFSSPEPFLTWRSAPFSLMVNVLKLVLRLNSELGIIHHDAHDENIVVNPDGSIALIDFGEATWLSPPSEQVWLRSIFLPELDTWYGQFANDAQQQQEAASNQQIAISALKQRIEAYHEHQLALTDIIRLVYIFSGLFHTFERT